MRFRSWVTPLFSLLLFSLPQANAQDVSKGRDFFIVRCLGCHAFKCNKEGPRLGGLPTGFSGGMNGAISAHSSSVVSLA